MLMPVGSRPLLGDFQFVRRSHLAGVEPESSYPEWGIDACNS